HLYNQCGESADVCIVDGHGGLYDGYSHSRGSDAGIARCLRMPVVLLVNARHMASTVAPLIYGFRQFPGGAQIAGVVFNQVSSTSHYALLRDACHEAGVECFGYLPHIDDCKLSTRHIGLTATVRRQYSSIIDRIGLQAEQSLQIDKLLACTRQPFPCPYSLPYSSDTADGEFPPPSGNLRIAMASDPAFNFVWLHRLQQLRRQGAVVRFSPVYGSDLPPADVVYLPGGYPELFARQLARRHRLKQQLADFASAGGRIMAEGGGVVFLGRSLTLRAGGTAYPMCDILPLDFTLADTRLVQGYRQWDGSRGYEHRYVRLLNPPPDSQAACNAKGAPAEGFLIRQGNIVASSAHFVC
ncbi:MAG: AAA family ATPase, partial [Bacteroidales bacterium]|nr:AAA family ATPase [Bacteroidales bacterium]